MTDKGRWFRIYPRQVEKHAKFRDLTGVELGAWMALRSAAELRDRALITDRDEAVLILKRRKIPRAAAVLDRLIGLRLFDVDEEGCIAVHDRADHDADAVTPEQRDHRRDHRRAEPAEGCGFCLIERWDRSEPPHGAWLPRAVEVDSPRFHPRGQPQKAAPATATEPAPATATASTPPRGPDSLPGEDDSATFACRLFVNGGRWLSDSEYTAAWDDLDRRYTADWVRSEIQPAYAAMHASNPKVKPWDLYRSVELRCAERSRSEDRKREQAIADQEREESERLRQKAANATEEDKQRASIVRRAVGLWIKRRPQEPVPTDFDDLKRWLDENEPRQTLERHGIPVEVPS